MLDRLIGLILFLFFWPLILLLALLIWIFSGWPIFYCQERVGYKKKIFWMIKFRTMRRNADELKEKYRQLNEADGPVFKIRNDPRLTKVGKFLFHSGLDELPQFINIMKGEMALVGPRPLPILEENKIRKEFKKREMVKPGILSPWVINGYHTMKFDDWMKSDLDYVKNKSQKNDFIIVMRGFLLMWKFFWREIREIIQL